jgi:hypothetical protein
MRLAAQAKMGYYPLPESVIPEIAKHLSVAGSSDIRILDPCAGQGVAIKGLSEALSIPQSNVYCVELHEGRGNDIRALMPEAKVVAPCPFNGTMISWHSFSAVYCNPPFDDQLGGGGREETNFLYVLQNLMVTNGVLVLVAPFSTFQRYAVMNHLDARYKQGKLYRLPDRDRKYNECVFIGRKRANAIADQKIDTDGYFTHDLNIGSYYYSKAGPNGSKLTVIGEDEWLQPPLPVHVEGPPHDRTRVWLLPESPWPPTRFLKNSYTEEELIAVIDRSPLKRLCETPKDPPPKRPPLPLGQGHVSVCLMAGMLDGLVQAGDHTHVVRGVSKKVAAYNEEASTAELKEDKDGNEYVAVKEVFSQQPTVVVRAVGRDGVIHTFRFDGSSNTNNDEDNDDATDSGRCHRNGTGY